MKAETLCRSSVILLALSLIPAGYLFIPPLAEVASEVKDRFMVLDSKAVACGFFALFIVLSVCSLIAGAILEDTEKREALAEHQGSQERLQYESELEKDNDVTG